MNPEPRDDRLSPGAALILAVAASVALWALIIGALLAPT